MDELTRELKDTLSKDITNIINLINNSSKENLPYLYDDLECLYMICNDFGIKDYPKIDIDFSDVDYQKFNDYSTSVIKSSYTNDPYFMSTLIYNIHNFFTTNKKRIRLNPSQKITLKETKELVIDFYSKFDKRYLKVYNDLVDSNRIRCFEVDDTDFVGTTEYGFFYSPYIFFINNNIILDATTIIHEVAHAYSGIEHQKLGNKAIHYQLFSNTLEICPNTVELFFYKYLEDINFCKKDIDYSYNEFILYLKKSALFCYKKYYCKNFVETGNVNNLNSQISILYGKAISLYLYSLNDKEKAIYLMDKINIDSCYKTLPDIVKSNNMDYDDIINFKSGKKLILEKWSK